MGWRFTTWRAEWGTRVLENPDSFQRVLDALIENAVGMMNHPVHPNVDPKSGLARRDDGELMESASRVTFILNAPGYWQEDLHVSVSADEVEVRGPDFVVRKRFLPDVDPASVEKSYTNGILEIRLKKLD
ncbi:MAG: Hsp20/alpha crystallin family protein [Thaumarchaeota archaeon]|nr:Hsp20/alpha crystallin family protein [Nitrososphaerota archaeon]